MFNQSGCCKKFIFMFSLFIFISINSIAFSQSYPSPLSSRGGVDTHVYKSDTVIFDATVIEDGSGTIEARTLTTGLSLLHSPYLSIFHIPLKYGVDDNIQLLFSLPYLTKTLVYNETHYIKSGYGDTMFGVAYAAKPLNLISSRTTVRITIPTGNVNAQDFDNFIPMGYGGYTTSLQESISTSELNVASLKMRLFLSGIGIFYFNSTQQSDMVTKYSFDKNFAWSVLGGVELSLTQNLDVQLKMNYIDVRERRYSDGSSSGKFYDANDSVKQINILPFIKHQMLDDISGQFGIVYPIKSIQDSSLAKTYDAEWKFVVGIEKKFSDGKTSKK